MSSCLLWHMEKKKKRGRDLKEMFWLKKNYSTWSLSSNTENVNFLDVNLAPTTKIIGQFNYFDHTHDWLHKILHFQVFFFFFCIHIFTWRKALLLAHLFFFPLTFNFELILELRKSCKDSREGSHISLRGFSNVRILHKEGKRIKSRKWTCG